METPLIFYRFFLHFLKYFWPDVKVFGKPRGPYAINSTLAIFPVQRLGLGKRDFFQKIDLR
jgi:hypothetical protein